MTRIIPPAPAHALGQHMGQGNGQAAVTSVGGASGTLARLQAGSILEGVVTGRDNAGATLLRTSQGTLSLPLFPPPTTGSSITVELQTLGTQIRAAILSVRPPAGQPTVPVNAPGAQQSAQGRAAGQGQPQTQPGGQPQAPLRGQPTGQAGGTAPNQPQGSAAPPPGPARPGATAPQGPTASTQSGVPRPAANPGVGTGGAGRGPAANPAGTAPRGAQMPVPGQPAGAAPAPGQAPAPSPAQPAPPPALGLSQDWPALRVALDTLASAQPQAAQAMHAALPAADAELPSNMLFFLSALGRGNLRMFVGQSTERALRSVGESQLLNRLSEDFSEIRRTAAEQRPDGFRLFLIPFHDGARLEQIRFLVREHEEERHTTGNRKGPATRFVFDVTMSRLGHLQLDGLAADRHLDLMIRSQRPLPETLRDEIRGLFAEARDALDFDGEVAFQVTREFPVDPAAQLAPPHQGPGGFVV